MVSGLKQECELPDAQAQELTLSQEREMAINCNNADLNKIESKIDSILKNNDVFSGYSQEVKDILKGSLLKEIYIKHGDNPNIKNISDGLNPTSKEYYISVKVDEFSYVSIKPNKVLEEYAHQIPNFNLELAQQSLEESKGHIESRISFAELKIEIGALTTAIEKATIYKQEQIIQRDKEINDSKVLGIFKWNAPKPIPSLKEQPLTKDEILKFTDSSMLNRTGYLEKLDDYIYRINEKNHDHWVESTGDRSLGWNHPDVSYNSVGEFAKGSENITTDAVRYALHGKNIEGTDNRIFEEYAFKTNQHEGSEVNAFRHTIWQAMITSEHGAEVAKEIGDAHEGKNHTLVSLDDYTRRYESVQSADNVVDLLNNEIGRRIGSENDLSRNDAASKVLDEFHKKGLYVVIPDKENGYRIERHKITDEQYNYMRDLFKQLNEHGVCEVNKLLDSFGQCAIATEKKDK